ncbi:aldehyde ferredoxin oxidoreductase family protein [Natronococcus sp. A-GB1]|uniref:aldehyde ferredoxin oxidoreductase family protein n=1 Tax=Natronococcus sp. A-GB1 TaxID=3037648 RepID=UPI00241C0334|nr:aldehyde ferredoxin oxidoreductase family protein [Natronococcus sp. A-GB1]MDG5761671.1 aldehyde ferredoxin oxidoreductase family protein [Natronococcus sp. A-GB1]
MSETLPPVYGGEILHIHLDTGETEIEAIDPDDARRFLGGNGFVSKQVAAHVPVDADPFDPENVLAMAVGPMNATAFQSTSRGVLGFISPLTDGFFDSTFGGTLPRAQKTTGFEVIVLHGRAEELTYVLITEDGAEVKSAENLAGQETYETCQAIRDREGTGYDTHVLAAGPAGENRVRYACLLHESKLREGVAGRGGSGAVLGSKNVKAIAVQEGDFQPDPEGDLRQRAVQQMGRLMADTEMLQNYGTAGLVNPVNEMGKLGQRNLQYEQTDRENAEAISGETLREEYVTDDTTCANCAVKCGKHVSIEAEGLTEAKIPEFETLFGTATMQEVYDPEYAIKVNDQCDRLGLDTISFGVTVAFARECYEKGLLEKDISPHLEFGDANGLIELTERVARREGFGNELAEGSFRLAASLADEAEQYLYGCKGLEFPAHSARGLKGMSIGYATATRGGSHHDTRPTLQYDGEHDETIEGTAEFAARIQHFTALGDSLTQCRFVSEGGWGGRVNENYAEAVSLATGWDLSVEDVERIGERVYNLERLINTARGIADRDTDTLPYRVMNEPIPAGPSEGMYCPPEELEDMLTEYYEFRGWNDNGHPTTETVERLELEDMAEVLSHQ